MATLHSTTAYNAVLPPTAAVAPLVSQTEGDATSTTESTGNAYDTVHRQMLVLSIPTNSGAISRHRPDYGIVSKRTINCFSPFVIAKAVCRLSGTGTNTRFFVTMVAVGSIAPPVWSDASGESNSIS